MNEGLPLYQFKGVVVAKDEEDGLPMMDFEKRQRGRTAIAAWEKLSPQLENQYFGQHRQEGTAVCHKHKRINEEAE